jgi:hypothetical protein
MSTPHLIASMRTACSAALHFGPQLSGAVLLRLGYLCLALFTAVGKAVHQSGDPRLVLAQLQLVEQFSQQLHRDQLAGALDAQVSGAHALSLESYAALRLPEDDPHAITDDLFAGPPPVVQGRSCYKNAEELLAAWLGIAYFEAQRRIADAHLLIGRRTPDGSICAPRFTELAKLYDQGTANRRAIASAARRLEKLEPQDTTFEGTATELVAHGDDGRTLDEFAAQTLKDLGPRAAQKKINSAIKTYKQTHGKQLPPKLGFFPGPVVNGVHFFSLRTNATDAQLIQSVSPSPAIHAPKPAALIARHLKSSPRAPVRILSRTTKLKLAHNKIPARPARSQAPYRSGCAASSLCHRGPQKNQRTTPTSPTAKNTRPILKRTMIQPPNLISPFAG